MRKLTAQDGHEFDVFEVGDINAKRGLLVAQEIFGVNTHMRNVSEHLAGFGYHVICPALFDRAEPGIELGYSLEEALKGRAIRAKIADAAVMMDLTAVAAALSGKPIGIIGYCWGGKLAWAAATLTHNFKAAISWYGGGIADTKDAIPNCPVQLHFAEQDRTIPLSDVEALRAAKPDMDIFIYHGAQHGFGCSERPSYSSEHTELAERRSLNFLAEHVR